MRKDFMPTINLGTPCISVLCSHVRKGLGKSFLQIIIVTVNVYRDLTKCQA